MLAHIHKPSGEFADVAAFTAYLGFREKGYEIGFFDYEDMRQLQLGLDTPVVGGFRAVWEALKLLGITPPILDYIPQSLARYAGRTIWTSTMLEVRQSVEAGRPIFAKPAANRPKIFTGQVFRVLRDTIASAAVPADFPVICSDVIEFVSEYRVYVVRREAIAIKHYKGDFKRFPEVRVIEAALADYADQPAGFGMDVGVLRMDARFW